MSDVLSQEEIDALLSGASFDDEPVVSSKSSKKSKPVEEIHIDVSKLANIGKQKVVSSLHTYKIDDNIFYSEPGSTVLHDEEYAKVLYNFDRVRHFVEAI